MTRIDGTKLATWALGALIGMTMGGCVAKAEEPGMLYGLPLARPSYEIVIRAFTGGGMIRDIRIPLGRVREGFCWRKAGVWHTELNGRMAAIVTCEEAGKPV